MGGRARGQHVSDARPASTWAHEQQELRDRAAAPGFDPPSVTVGYRVVGRPDRGFPPGGGGLVPRLALLGLAVAAMLVETVEVLRYAVVAAGFVLIVRWFWRPPNGRPALALYGAGSSLDGVPTLVVAVADDDLAGVPTSGAARAFGEVGPGGALGVVLGGATVWPTWPPRVGTRRDRA